MAPCHGFNGLDQVRKKGEQHSGWPAQQTDSLAVVLCKYLVYLFLFGISSSVKMGCQHYLRHRTALID